MKTKLSLLLHLLSLLCFCMLRIECCDLVSEMPDDMHKLMPYYEFLPKLHYRNYFFADEYNLKFNVLNAKIFK